MQATYFVIVGLVLIIVWQIYQINWTPLAQAKAAAKAVLIKQRADVASLSMRTDLMLQKLSDVRAAHIQETESYQQFAAQLGQNLDSEGEIVRGNAYARVSQRQKELEAATTMVRSFQQSFVFFTRKWSEQISTLIDTFPVMLKEPQKSGLQTLLDLPSALAEPQARLKEKLGMTA